jgi:hypothetical protein
MEGRAADRKSVGWVFELAEPFRITVSCRQLGEDRGRLAFEQNAQRSRMGHTRYCRNRIQLLSGVESLGK